MARRHSARMVRSHRIYTIAEAADALGCHRRTVIRWILEKGLAADLSARPWLIRGGDLKAFLGHRAATRRCRLALHQLYCVGCRAPREPGGKLAEFRLETPSTGHLTALCPECLSVMNKKIRRADLETIRAKVDVTVLQAQPTLVSRPLPCVDVPFVEEGQTHGKAQ